MLKVFGALCVMAGALWCALGAVRELARRADVLAELTAALAYLEEELAFRMPPLPRLLGRLAQERPGAAGQFFGAVAAGLRNEPEAGLYQSWRQAMTRQLPMLRPEERKLLLEVGQTLGRYDAKTQRQALGRSRERLGVFRDEARGEARRLGKVYAAVTLAGGAAIVLVLA